MPFLAQKKETIIKYAPFAGLGGIGFLLLCILVVLLTYQDQKAAYSIFNHFISELGHSTYSPFYWAFSIGLCVAGPMMAILMMGLAYHLDNKVGYWAMRVGMFSGIACFFIGIFPADLFLKPHLIAALIFFFGSLITAMLTSIAIYLDKADKIPKWYIIPSLIVVINGVIFLSLPTEMMAEFLKDREAFDRPAFWLNPFFEWLVFFSLALWVVLIAFFLRKVNSEKEG